MRLFKKNQYVFSLEGVGLKSPKNLTFLKIPSEMNSTQKQKKINITFVHTGRGEGAYAVERPTPSVEGLKAEEVKYIRTCGLICVPFPYQACVPCPICVPLLCLTCVPFPAQVCVPVPFPAQICVPVPFLCPTCVPDPICVPFHGLTCGFS